jgi:hypothetical protein
MRFRSCLFLSILAGCASVGGLDTADLDDAADKAAPPASTSGSGSGSGSGPTGPSCEDLCAEAERACFDEANDAYGEQYAAIRDFYERGNAQCRGLAEWQVQECLAQVEATARQLLDDANTQWTWSISACGEAYQACVAGCP